MTDRADLRIGVIGGGIAGASAAYHLISHESRPSVVLLEAEAQLGHHTTGRSAAQYIENYGATAIRPLTRASHQFFADPPPDYSDGTLLSPLPILTVCTPGQEEVFERDLAAGQASSAGVSELSIAEACAMAPLLKPDAFGRAMIEAGASDIDVAALLQCFVRGFRALGGQLATAARVDAATAAPGRPGRWLLDTTTGPVEVDLVVNAAGAWGDVVAETAGVEPVGLQPLRRTAFMVASPFAESVGWPMLSDADLSWYLKPDGPQFLCSPADETPSAPLDAKPEELDVAVAIDRINAVTTLDIRSVRSSWAGLRTFVPDRSMVLGPDTDQPTFIWCVGQGGNGIQTAPAAGRLLTELSLDGAPGPDFDRHGLDLDGLTVARLRR
jgi:D-arginine dehydrogenase